MKHLPIRSFRLRNFKAVRDSGTVKFGSLTVFIGNNGSGKSSLIEGLETFRDIVLEGLDAAMGRWRGFEHVWNHAVTHKFRSPKAHRPNHANPMSFRVQISQETGHLSAKQDVNMGEGGNELFIQHERVLRKGERLHRGQTESVTRNGYGKLVLGRMQKAVPVSPQLDDGASVLKDMIGQDLVRWQFLNLVPDAMGQLVPQQRASGNIRLAKNGVNVAEYLNEIRKLDLEAFKGILLC